MAIKKVCFIFTIAELIAQHVRGGVGDEQS
jgi:hypothetical protein